MKLSIIIIGDEILIGQVTDTNSGEIARTLGPAGWEVEEVRVIGDNEDAIKEAVAEAMKSSQLVITTGGMGPTKDDITKKVLTEYFGGELRHDAAVAANIEEVFKKRGLTLNDLTRAQAMVPTSCRVINNSLGTAPILWFEKDGKVLVAMPGVPFETVGMLHKSVARAIGEHFSTGTDIMHHTLIISGITESDLAARLAEWESQLPAGIHLAYLPDYGYIRLRLDGVDVAAPVFEGKVKALKDLVHDWLIHDGDNTPAEIVLGKLKAKGYTLATAESCTGGNIAHEITSVAGSSENYLGSVVSYCNTVKQNVLGVSEFDLRAEGAVSEPVVIGMAEGAARVIGADCAIATSGIAGPGGGTPQKPVGTVWISVRTPSITLAECRHFAGNRERVIKRATTEALLLLARQL